MAPRAWRARRQRCAYGGRIPPGEEPLGGQIHRGTVARSEIGRPDPELEYAEFKRFQSFKPLENDSTTMTICLRLWTLNRFDHYRFGISQGTPVFLNSAS